MNFKCLECQEVFISLEKEKIVTKEDVINALRKHMAERHPDTIGTRCTECLIFDECKSVLYNPDDCNIEKQKILTKTAMEQIMTGCVRTEIWHPKECYINAPGFCNSWDGKPCIRRVIKKFLEKK
jgi:hypothetical protein